MSEYVVLEAPSIFRWKGPKQGRTMFSATGGRLLLTDRRLVFQAAALTDDVPLGSIVSCELTGRMGNLTVVFRNGDATSALTFGTQQLGMPVAHHWVTAIEQGVAAARPRAPAVLPAPEHPVPPADRIRAAEHPALRAFAARGSAPRVLSWRLADVVSEAVVPPGLGRVEVWRDVESVPPIHYVALVVAYRPDGEMVLAVGAEVAPQLHAECYLGVFAGVSHHNLVAHPELRDEEHMIRRGVEVALGYLDAGTATQGVSSQPPPWDTAVAPVVAVALTPEEAQADLASLRGAGVEHRDGMPAPVVVDHLGRSGAALRALGAPDELLATLAAGARGGDPAALHHAGAALMGAGLHDLAAPVLATALAQGRREPDLVVRLAVSREATGGAADSLATLREHAWALADASARDWCAHYAALTGDLDLVRLMTQAPAGSLTPMRRRSLGRLARADALTAAGCPPTDLREWVAVLHGAVLLHLSPFGTEEMNGRHAALWDDAQRIVDTLTLLEWVLVRCGRSSVRVVAAADRDSQILGHLVRDRLVTTPESPGGPTLVVQYRWDAQDETVLAHREDATAVLFGYAVDWTRDHATCPDVVGTEAQMITPVWGERMRSGDDGVVSVPADDRPSERVGEEVAATVARTVPYVHDDAAGLRRTVAVLQSAAVPMGIFDGVREPYLTGGPVTSNRF